MELGEFIEIYRRDMDDVKDGLKKVTEAIEGNGRPGIKERVKSLEVKVATVVGALVVGMPMLFTVSWDYLKHLFRW